MECSRWHGVEQSGEEWDGMELPGWNGRLAAGVCEATVKPAGPTQPTESMDDPCQEGS